MEAVRFAEASVNVCRTTRQYSAVWQLPVGAREFRKITQFAESGFFLIRYNRWPAVNKAFCFTEILKRTEIYVYVKVNTHLQ
jgi:hypothetical protein